LDALGLRTYEATSGSLLDLPRYGAGEHSLAVVITGWEAGARAAQMEAESCRIFHHMHRIVFNEIVRDAEIAYAISPIVRKHHLTEEETEKFLLELRIPRAANVAGITDRLVVFQKSQLADKLLTEGEL
jgi:hypothetical protein